MIEQIKHFLERYKDQEKYKWVKGARWIDAPETEAIVRDAMERANQKVSIR